MPSTYSPILRIELPANFEQQGIWGQTTSRNLGTLIESSIAGLRTVPLPNANYTLSALNGADDEARYAALRFTGTLTATREVIVPTVSKFYRILNSTNQSLVIKTSMGTGRTVAAGKTVYLFVDSINTTDAFSDFADLTIAGFAAVKADGGTYAISISGNAATATTANAAATLQTARTISLAGDVTGAVSFNGGADVTLTATVVDNSHNHSTGTITGFVEDVQDVVGGMLVGPGAGQAGISVVYDDANGKLVFNTNDFAILLIGDVTGSATVTDLGSVSISTTIAPNSVALGSDTTGDYIANGSVSGIGLSGGASGEGSTFTVSSNATSANSGGTLVARDASGNFAASQITNTISNVNTVFPVAQSVSFSGSVSLDVSSAQYFFGTLTAAVTFSFSNPPLAGRVGEFIVELGNAGNFVVTWPANTKWSGGVTPVRTTNGIDLFAFSTIDGGVTWRGSLIIKDSR